MHGVPCSRVVQNNDLQRWPQRRYCYDSVLAPPHLVVSRLWWLLTERFVMGVCSQAVMAVDNVRMAAGVSGLPQLLSDVPEGLGLSEAATRIMGSVMQVGGGLGLGHAGGEGTLRVRIM